MTQLISRGYEQASFTTEDQKLFQLFCSNLTLILNNKQHILNCRDYFFVAIPGAYCSHPFVNTDGILFLGYLIESWDANLLTAICSNCQGKVLVTWCSGSVLSGRNQYSGICFDCKNTQIGRWTTFSPHWQFVSELRKKYPDKISYWEEYDDYEFSFGGNGLKPARKTKLIWKQLAQPISLQTLVNELTSSSIRQNKAPNVCLLKDGLELKPFSRS